MLAVITLVAARWLLPDRHHERRAQEAADPSSAPPRASRAVLGRLFLVGMAIALAELPPNDWSALMMSDRFDVTAGQAGLGFVAVAGGMFVGRVVGDLVTDRFGLDRTRRVGAALAGVGVLIATTAPHPVLAGGGLFVTGLGSVLAVPAGLQGGQRPHPRLPQRDGVVLVGGPARVPHRLAADGVRRRADVDLDGDAARGRRRRRRWSPRAASPRRRPGARAGPVVTPVP